MSPRLPRFLSFFTIALLTGGIAYAQNSTAPAHRSQESALTAMSADDLDRAGFQAEGSFDFAKASKFYAASAEKNPDRPKIWDSVGFAYEMNRQYDEAIAAYKKAIEKDPREQYAYKRLGVVYEILGQYDSAIEELRKQLEMKPADFQSHQELANIYITQRKYDLAKSEFQAEIQNLSPPSSLDFERGEIELGLHHDGTALVAFRSALQHATDSMMPRAIAAVMADNMVHLDVAEQLASMAIQRSEAESNKTSLATISYDSVRSTALVADSWETMGWVRFAQGNIKAAEDYTRASWAINDESSSTALHLGKIYEKESRDAEAIHAYALSLSCRTPPVEARERLGALVGEGKIDSVVGAAKLVLSSRRSIQLPNSRAYEGTAEFWMLLSPAANPSAAGIADLKFTSVTGKDGKKLHNYTEMLRGAALPYTFPPGEQTKLLVRAALVCTRANASCILTPYRIDQTLRVLFAQYTSELAKRVHSAHLPD